MSNAVGGAPQINPPFDGSEPCPACQQDVRGMSASIHNFLTRCKRDGSGIESGKAMQKLLDLRDYHGAPFELTVPHPAAVEVVAVGHALIEAIDGITVEAGYIRWTPEIRAKVEALIPRAMAAEDAFDVLSKAHFADERHATNHGNILRERRGSAWAGFVNPEYKAAEYNFTVEQVEQVEEGADLTHTVCGQGLKLHEHFKENLRKDPTFYGQVWCPRCRLNAPAAQFACAPAPALEAAE